MFLMEVISMSNKKVLIFNGSPRKKGTSYSFARTFKNLIEKDGNSAEIIHIIEYLEEGKCFSQLKQLIASSDVIALSSPLYVDSLPYPVIWFFEKLLEKFSDELNGKRFFTVAQCAFPYAHLLNTLLGSCRCFAEEAKMKWLGGLGYGGGVMIDGARLESLGKKGQKITSAFEIALRDVYEDREIAVEVQETLAMKFPRILARPMAAFLNHRIKVNAGKRGLNMKDIRRKAYLEEKV